MIGHTNALCAQSRIIDIAGLGGGRGKQMESPLSVCGHTYPAPCCRANDPPLDPSSTLRYMSSEAIRIESETLNALRDRSAQSGEPIVRLAQRYIGEGMRLDRHPGIVFRDGPSGRRAVVIGGPDVWEVIAAARSAPERGEKLVRALAERIGVPPQKIRIAVSYYGEYPDEIDRFIAANEQEADQLERALGNEQRLLG